MSALPFFYQDIPFTLHQSLALNEDTVRHVALVLRMQAKDELNLTNGKGIMATCQVQEITKKMCTVTITGIEQLAPLQPALHLAIAFTRNNARNEWLLEKATELGVQRITPLITARSDRERFRYDRLHNILVSAMLQSQQSWLPQLDEPTALKTLLTTPAASQMYIAHCMEAPARMPLRDALQPGNNALLLIGPEGDFSPEEVTLAISQGAIGITLAGTRLRTETAAISACAYFHLVNDRSHEASV